MIFLFERYADSIIDVTWVQNLLHTTFRFVIRGEMLGLDNSTMKDFLDIL